MKLHKIIFMNSMILGTLIAISSYSWLTMWMGLEINLLSIIPMMSDKKNIFSSESSLKYFITQALASLILLMTVIMMLMTDEFINPLMNFYSLMMMNTALLTKVGAAPFHFWLPEVIEGLSWMNSLIILTWQKIAPMMLIMNNKINTQFLISVIIISLIVSTIMAFNQISLRKILAFSSINHIAWMLSTLMISLSIWTTYFIIYSVINISLISVFSMTKCFYMNQINNIMNQNKMLKFTFMTNFLSLGGLPPFIGFLPKWLVINWMTQNNFMLITFIMIITTLIMLFVYIRVMMSTLVLNLTEPKTFTANVNNKMLITINMINLNSMMFCTLMINMF